MDDAPTKTKRQIRECIDETRLMEAMVLAKRAMRDFETDPDFQLLLAEIYEIRGDVARALLQHESILTRSPSLAESQAAVQRLRDQK
jgi:protein involved in temperature-dependent protein secretion